MKAKKALKRLRKVEELLSVVIDEFVASEPSVGRLLDAAKKSVIRAKAGISFQPVPFHAKKPQAKAKRPERTVAAKKKTPAAGKERPTAAKRSSKVVPSADAVEERDTTKSRFAAAPMSQTAGQPALDGSPETQHAN